MAVMSARAATNSPAFAAANSFLKFVNASPTPFHAVNNASALLEEAGFQRVDEGSNWEKNLTEGSKVYYTR